MKRVYTDVTSYIKSIQKGMIAVLVENSTVVQEIQLELVKHNNLFNNLIVYDPDSNNDDWRNSNNLSRLSSLYSSSRNP